MSDRTVEPSRRRLEMARQAGHVVHSRMLTAAAALAGTLAAWHVWGEDLTIGLVDALRAPTPGLVPSVEALSAHLGTLLRPIAAPLVGLAIAPLLLAILAHQLQVGGLFAPGLVMPNLRRLRVFRDDDAGDDDREDHPAAHRLVRSAVQAGTIALGALVLFVTFRGHGYGVLEALQSPWPGGLSETIGLIQLTLTRLVLLMCVAGGLDYFLNYRAWRQRLLSTPQEHREEQRALEGDPSLRGRRKRFAQQYANSSIRGAGGVDSIGPSGADS